MPIIGFGNKLSVQRVGMRGICGFSLLASLLYSMYCCVLDDSRSHAATDKIVSYIRFLSYY